MRKTLLTLIILSFSANALSDCASAYADKYRETRSKMFFKKNDGAGFKSFMAVWGGASLGWVAGGVYHSATYPEETEWSGSTFQEAYSKAYAYQEAEEAASMNSMTSGAISGALTGVATLATLGVRDLFLKRKANQYLKVMEVAAAAKSGNYNETYDRLYKDLSGPSSRLTTEALDAAILKMFQDDIITCPADRPVKFKKFKENLEFSLKYDNYIN